MARHIMAVCVVCLLCADRLPCQQHIEGIFPETQQLPNPHPNLNAKVYQHADFVKNPPQIQATDKHFPNNFEASNKVREQKNHIHHRRKRHVGHGDERVRNLRPEITDEFLVRIFSEYGQGDGRISASEFKRMLKQLGLHQLLETHFIKEANNETCISDSKLMHHIQSHDLSHKNHNQNKIPDHSHQHDELTRKAVNCTLRSNGSTSVSLHEHNHIHSEDETEGIHIACSSNYSLSAEDVINICPVLLYQLASPSTDERTGCIKGSVLSNVDKYEAADYDQNKEDIFHVWVYAFVSVFACSILGLVGVAIIPFMDSRYYKHIIQYLVSLAVGTMTGDALLHLLPHAIAGQSEKNMVFKGLACMGGIIFFYITEHGLTMISEWRKKIAKKETKQPSRAKVVRDPDSSINNSVAGDKLCKSKYSSYPYCYDEIAMDSKNDVWLHYPNNTSAGETLDIVGNISDRRRNTKTEADVCEMAAQSLLSTSQNNYAPMTELNNHHHNHNQHHHKDHQHHLPDSNTISTDLDGNSVGDLIGTGTGTGTGTVNGNNCAKEKSTGNDTVTVILREHESSHHGHSHKHGHVHSPPESLSAVAWMIIMGDGLHNFTDGMAIGAAFAENIAGGFSTSLAVFCHELPHELGDFAILIKAGMSVKSAVYYNLMTGILSFIGMIFGIVFGQSAEVAQWMFAAAAGLFIYIALVDMMPELSAAHKSIEQFVLQILGMSSGVILMLFIAIYEDDLMNVFSATTTAIHDVH
ncbi:zinc transporter foi [Teleopsis dalmanni]|uniref:zinc transporter foi n=1 Tax=Teleopsis dalmanni TaxID=139649 RepID=UPI0018CE1516|nr:zinc transporter foi [Teleopsis dalmanni]XP_037956218.1 zinc transporter foi [Teleopsis dalmanni]XP_037956292.1 zinc transporter foi [Teleopsis dalmanni]